MTKFFSRSGSPWQGLQRRFPSGNILSSERKSAQKTKNAKIALQPQLNQSGNPSKVLHFGLAVKPIISGIKPLKSTFAISRRFWSIGSLFATGFCLSSATALAADTPYLAGIHWYHSDPSNSDVEALTGGRPAWVVDQALLDSASTLAAPNPWETPWVTSPSVDKSQPYAKPGYIQAITAKGHTAIMRLHPQWGVNVPYGSDPYNRFAFADDCKAAANLMKNVRVWQIGNEANLYGEMNRWNAASQKYDIPWTGPELVNAPEQYAQTYIACRDKIHEITPQTTPATQIVLMQPCSPGPAGADRYLSSEAFLARMIAAVPDKSKIDGFALHSYAQPGGANFGADGFMDDLRRQIAIIDQFGLGDRPIFITEFNKHMPNATEAAIGAQFVTTAYSLLNQWNTGAAALWPASANHPVRGTAWFVYRGGAGWDDYSLQYWKTQAGSTSPAVNPWYGFQAAANQAYPAGTGSGPLFTPSSQWWDDSFNASPIDTTWPLPAWEVDAPAGTAVGITMGAARITASNAFTLAGLRHSRVAFADFSMELDVWFQDARPVAAGEANMDIRVRQEGAGGPGYSITLFSSLGSSSPGQVQLRRTSTWGVTRSATISGGINTNDEFRVQVWGRPSSLEIKVLRLPALTTVLDWTGPNAIPTTEFRAGGMGLYTYNMRDLLINNVRMGGPEMLSNSAVQSWGLYD